jgi:glycosyltransferase involved in cell wall biosynthesis
VIGAKVGGLPEVVEHGVSGYLGAPGNVDEMARGALDLLTDDARYRAASQAARHGAERFATEKVVPMYEEIYAQVAG